MATATRAAVGERTTATGADPNRVFEFRYKVIDLDDLISSHDATLAVNPRFPSELQPRFEGIDTPHVRERKPRDRTFSRGRGM